MKFALKGFTLVELIILIVIIAIVSTTVIIRLPNVSQVTLESEAEQLAANIRYTQNLSMTRGKRFYLTSLSTTSYQILGVDGTLVPMARGTNSVTLGKGITISGATNLPNSLIAFSTNGTPYTSITAPLNPLTNAAVITLTAAGVSKTITILPETGRVSVP